MNILLFIGAKPGGDTKGISRRVHYDFICRLGEKNSFHTYGPWETDSKLSPLKFNPKQKFSRIIRYYTPDVILAYSLFTTHYWLPKEFATTQVPKVCIEVDYWNLDKRARNWYKENNFNFIIQRGFYPRSVIPAVWLPFSCNEKFIKNQNIPIARRQKKLVFVGRGGDQRKRTIYYPIRKKAIGLLSQKDLLKNIGRVYNDKYVGILGEYFCYLCDSGRFDSPPAKTFEIMGSGACLFTTHFQGYKRLFDQRPVCFFYYRDLVDIHEAAKEVLRRPNTALQRVASNAASEVNKRHLDKHRIEDLNEILYDFIVKGELTQKWGI